MTSLALMVCFLVSLASFTVSAPAYARADDSKAFNELYSGRLVFDVSPAISEVSSVVYDPEQDTAWVHGDSGTPAEIGRLQLSKNETDIIAISGAANIDWEAMVLTDDGNLWILDVGDNLASREDITCYRVNPALLDESMVLEVLQTITLSYPEGPMDVEAAVFKDGRIYLFEKISIVEFRKARIVSIDVSPGAETDQVAEEEGWLPVIVSITDASISPEGDLYVLTYYGIFKCFFWQEKPRLSVFSKFFFLGQQEAMAALGKNFFLVGVETGKFYLVKKWLPLIPF